MLNANVTDWRTSCFVRWSMSRTGSTALPQITFILHEEEDGWWAEWPYMGYSATAATKEAVMQLCREGVQIITSRPGGIDWRGNWRDWMKG